MTIHRASAQAAFDTPAPRGEGLYLQLRAAGRRGVPPAMAGDALPDYWRCVAESTVADRADILRRLRADIAAGRTGPRACLPVALGEPHLELSREATQVYLGAGPTSAERRDHAVADVLDWIARSLALNRAALCCALLDTANAVSLERLAPLRRHFSAHEAYVIFGAVGEAAGAEVAAFLEDWRALVE